MLFCETVTSMTAANDGKAEVYSLYLFIPPPIAGPLELKTSSLGLCSFYIKLPLNNFEFIAEAYKA